MRNRTEHSTVPININRFDIGLVSNRDPLHAPVIHNGSGPVVAGDALIDGLNVEISNNSTLIRRPGFPEYCSQQIPSGTPLGFGTLLTDGNTNFLDTTTDVFSFDTTSLTSVYTKNTTEQSHFQQVDNHLYWADGTDARRLVFGLDGLTTAKWGIDPPRSAPGVAQILISGLNTWAASTFFSSNLILLDSNGNIQKLTTGGTTGAAEPTWATVAGNTTTDGSAVWTCQGTGTRATSHAYSLGAYIRVSFSKTISTQQWNPYINSPYGGYETVTSSVPYDYFFKATTAGTSSSTATGSVTWPVGNGSSVTDGTVVWTVIGNKSNWASIGGLTAVSTATSIVDSNGNQQNIQSPGKTGSGSHPTWNTTTGGLTTDGTIIWSNAGPISAANTGVWKYLFVYRQSAWNFNEDWYHISAASPVSFPILLGAGYNVSVSGTASSDDSVTNVDIYRTKQGGSTYYYLDTLADPAGPVWNYVDTLNDDQLDTSLTMTTVPLNLPPPAGSSLVAYWQGRVWVASGAQVFYDGGGDITNGDPHQSFPLANVFTYPGEVTGLVATDAGLVVSVNDEMFVILGGPQTTSFYTVPLFRRTGVFSPNAIQQDQDTVYLLSGRAQGLGFSTSDFGEFGQNIGDILKTTFPPASSYLALHRDGPDVGIFISDGSTSIVRFNPTTGAWSSIAEPVGGCGSIASLPTDNGYVLLTTIGGYICGRDLNSFVDGHTATTYTAFGTLGSLDVAGMAGPSAAIRNVYLRTTSAGSRPVVSILQNETSGTFSTIQRTCSVPAKLNGTPYESTTVRQDRYDLASAEDIALSEFNHLQLKVSWPAENQKNELVSLAIGDEAR
jgi:hypothetical protein